MIIQAIAENRLNALLIAFNVHVATIWRMSKNLFADTNYILIYELRRKLCAITNYAARVLIHFASNLPTLKENF